VAWRLAIAARRRRSVGSASPLVAAPAKPARIPAGEALRRVWNTTYMDAALSQLRHEGYPVRDEDAARLSPLVHDHINVLGRYSFAVPNAVTRGELRPLRDPTDSGA
jgi:hypothetical protein